MNTDDTLSWVIVHAPDGAVAGRHQVAASEVPRRRAHASRNGVNLHEEGADCYSCPTVRAVPSVRAAGAWDGLVPDGWHLSEWRGGSCASIARWWTDDEGHRWEVVVLPDGDLTVPRAEREHETWVVGANRWEDESDDYPYGATWQTTSMLTLPAFHEGDTFPDGHVDAWLHEQVDVRGATEAV